MNDNNDLFHSLSALNDINWNANQYNFYVPQIKDYLAGLKNIPQLISVPELIDFFRNNIFNGATLMNFSELTEQQKTFISIIFISSKFLKWSLRIVEKPHAFDPRGHAVLTL